MSSSSEYAVRAWRSDASQAGVVIGAVFPVGYDNHVTEIMLHVDDVDEFCDRVRTAAMRAQLTLARFEEKLPGPYERWEGQEGPLSHEDPSRFPFITKTGG